MKHEHVIACLYKVDYTNLKGFCNTSCPEQVCAWNQGIKKELVPKRTADLFVRNSLASSENKNVNKIPCEEARIKKLSAFDPRIEGYRLSNSDDVSNFLHKVQIDNETSDTTVCSDFSSLIVQNVKKKVLLQRF